MKTVLHFMSSYKKESVLAPLFKMFEALLELFVPLVVASIIDVGILKGDKSFIITRCLMMLALAVFGMVCAITAQYFAAKTAVGSAAAMRKELFQHILSFGYVEMDQVGSSTLITRMTSDINQVQNGINMALRLFLRSPFIVFGAMIMAFTIDWKAAMIFVVTIPLLSVVVFGVMFVTKPMYKNVQAGVDRILGITRENLTGVRVIRAFHQEKGEIQRFNEANEELTVLQKLAGRISGLTNPLTFVIINFAILFLIYTGALRVNDGTLSTGQVVALYNYMSQILVELVKLANLIILETKAIACMNRIDDIFAAKASMKGGNEVFGDKKEKGIAISFDDVSFTYEGAREASLQNISFEVKAGDTLGIIGGTGAGKSSLIQLIARFYDASEGKILLDGKAIESYDLSELRHDISLVPQKAQLFKGSIRENLLFGNDQLTEKDLERALEISQAKEFVDAREGGLDAPVEQGGRNLSGGQKQRLTLARAIARNAGILIMDDSASALDFATDAKLRKAIKEMEDRPTTIIVSQRASSMMHADQILVLEDGKMAGLGSHEELMKSCEVYQEIYGSQYE
ncbi:MAG: ABC transporter ATP-binding protein [Eubacteriales bacterium]|nr:ABC transporter ATP-binding protein [Eubacteriales bacterium]